MYKYKTEYKHLHSAEIYTTRLCWYSH